MTIAVGDPTRRRRWFQIHLGTAVALSFSVGVLMCLQQLPSQTYRFGVIPWCDVVYDQPDRRDVFERAAMDRDEYVEFFQRRYFGWPYVFAYERRTVEHLGLRQWNVVDDPEYKWTPFWMENGLKNLVCWALGFAAIAAGCEWLIRWRARRET